MPANNIILVGFMGSGKTTLGRALASQLGRTFIDTDAMIEERAGMSIPELFTEYGEEHFRDLEQDVARDLVKESGAVVSTGGGIVLNPANMAAMKSAGLVVALGATLDTVMERLGDKPAGRPMLSGAQSEDASLRRRLESLMTEREPLYAQADVTLPTDGKSVEELVASLATLWKRQGRF